MISLEVPSLMGKSPSYIADESSEESEYLPKAIQRLRHSNAFCLTPEPPHWYLVSLLCHSPLHKLLPSDSRVWWSQLCSLNITELQQYVLLVAVVLSGTLFSLGCNIAFRSNILPYYFPSSPWDSAKSFGLSGSHCAFGISSTIQREETI